MSINTKVLIILRGRGRWKRPDLWAGIFILHWKNAWTLSPLSLKQFFAEKNVTVLEHSSYSPEAAPCDFFVFLKVKSALEVKQLTQYSVLPISGGCLVVMRYFK